MDDNNEFGPASGEQERVPALGTPHTGADNTMVAGDTNINDSAGEQQPEADSGAGVGMVGRATRSISALWQGRTPAPVRTGSSASSAATAP